MLRAVICLASILYCSLVYAADQPFAVGETIHYSVRKLGLRGKASLVYQGPVTFKGQKLVLVVFTTEAFNFFDQENIYLDPEDYRPVFVERDLNIFGKKEKIFEEYLPDEGKIMVTKEASGKTSTQQLEVKGAIDNIYGFIYRYRKQGVFKVGDTLDVRLPTQQIKIKLTKRTTIKAAGKTYDSYYMHSDPDKYKLWFGAGPMKLPLRISGAAGFGNTVMIMTDYSTKKE